ncbi:hypothetical protein HPB47_004271 [Ixodes persulcatus]|uniref:Uncharacterized protein n=1 Tax=Ixodes persulcatus TaxID=34615 RepID=A0AC60PHD0_IXOPE|nr:hypothetical protein HPB47_004271 [Ixodes persulcatus]
MDFLSSGDLNPGGDRRSSVLATLLVQEQPFGARRKPGRAKLGAGQGNHQGHGHFQGQGNFQGPSNFQETRAQPLGMNQGHHGGFSPEPHVSIQPASVKVVYVPVVSTSIKASSLSKLTGEQALSKEQGHSNFQGPVQQNSQQEAPKSVSYSNSFNGKASALNKPYTRSSTSGHATIPIIIIQKDHHSHMKSQQSGGYQTQPVQSVQTQVNLSVHCKECLCEPFFSATTILGRHRDKVTREVLEAFHIHSSGKKCISAASVALSGKELEFLKLTMRVQRVP